MGQVDRVLASKTENKTPYRDFRCRVRPSQAGPLYEAATARGMSVGAYIRRATLAFVAYDLGLDLTDLLEDEPPTRIRFAQPGNDQSMRGQGHGSWRIGHLTVDN
jgi:hypothetical protein